MAVALLGLGVLVGGVIGTGGAFAQTPTATATPAPRKPEASKTPITAKLTKEQAEQAALTASPGNTIDHTTLQNQNGTPVYDVDFTNGGGVLVNGDTGAIIKVEAEAQTRAARAVDVPVVADMVVLAAKIRQR